MRHCDAPTIISPGVTHLGDEDALALLLGSGEGDDLLRARHILEEFGGWLGLARASVSDISAVGEVSPATALRIKVALDIGRRQAQEDTLARPRITPDAAAWLFQATIGSCDQEHLAVLCLDGDGRALGGLQIVAIGSLDTLLTRIGEIYRPAVALNAASVVIGHNHPSQVVSPSGSDLRLTRAAIAAGTVLGVVLDDHLIVSASSATSLREWGGVFA